MASWLDNYNSLNWVNKKKLSQQIIRLDKNTQAIKENLLSLLAVVNHLELYCKELTEMSGKQQLTAQHILDLKPLLERSEEFNTVLKNLHIEELNTFKQEGSSPTI